MIILGLSVPCAWVASGFGLGVLVLNQLLVGLLHDALSREVFEVMHEGGGVLLVLGVLLHSILNWNWVRANFLKKSLPGP